ncbi:hypothetical protein JHK86_043836 [Glycine max]|nr:hypothetical protein JHK86_043836 [Glycine max]
MFTYADFIGSDPSQDDPMVAMIVITGWEIRKTLIDLGSGADILYWYVFVKFYISHNIIQPHEKPMIGFIGEIITVKANQVDVRECYVKSCKIELYSVREDMSKASTFSVNAFISALEDLGPCVDFEDR